MSTRAVIAILAPLFLGSAPFCAGNIRIGDTPARRIAKETTLRGKYVDGQCLPFALALHARFRAAGIPSKVITFRYETLPTPHAIFNERRAIPAINARGGITGSHAVVAYEDQGRTYVMDNQSWQPRWIHEGSPLGMARQFSGMDILIAKARLVDNSRFSKASEGRMRAAHLFRAHALSLRQQVIAQSRDSRFRPKMAAAGRRHGLFAPNRRQPLRKEGFHHERPPGVCQNKRRPLFRVSSLAFR